MNAPISEYTVDYFLTAGECSPQQEMPVTLLAHRVIELATLHANYLGVGYARLIVDGQAWVLSRLTIEVSEFPKVNTPYSLRTWIEGFNRHFSERNFELTGADGRVLGYVRTIWMAIDINKREAADLSHLDILPATVSDRPCPIAKASKLRPLNDDASKSTYTFRYCDCDFNRHVNTVRYMELYLNQWDMEFYDRHSIDRIELAFMHEAHFGDCAEVRTAVSTDGDERLVVRGEIVLPDGTCATRALMRFRSRN